jgi:membrane protein DedA with SNARE-associated domain
LTFAQASSGARDLRSRRIRTIAGVFFILLCLPTLWLGFRTYRSLHLLRSAYAAGAPKTSSIRPWMTLGYVATTYGATEEQLRARLQVPVGTDPGANLKSIADKTGVSPSEYLKRVQQAFADLGRANGAPTAKGRSTGWLEVLNDQVLTSLLNYGYPALGLTLLLGSVGLPVPDGLAMTVAGALAMGGRMNILWAGGIALVASVIGDIVGYGIGNLLDREALERRGRWLGLTVLRRIRVEALFESWGGLTVFVTRTFASYLSPVASLLAGLSRYPFGKYLALTAAGRVVWTCAYLALGYAVGTDIEAASGFLTNLSALLLCAVVALALGSLATGRVVPSWPAAHVDEGDARRT